jgi:hypothetical protein
MIPCRYVVSLHRLHIIEVRRGLVDVLKDGLTVTPAGCEPLEITLTPKKATVDVSVELCETLWRFVTLLRIAAPGVSTQHDMATAEKPAHFDSLAPGEYRAFATRPDAQIEFRNPAVLQALRARAAAIVVKAGEVQMVVAPLFESDGDGGIR